MVVNNSLHQLKRQLSQETQGQEDKKKIEELLQKMHRMMERISIIANALKIYSQENKNSSNERVEISSFIEKIIDSNDKNPAKSGVKISFIKSQTSIFCNINKDQIQQCIINLIDNSIEACQNQAQPHITISLSTLDSYIYINISDNGKGVSKEIINKIMQPFFTTKEIGTGMGLGLSVALGIARNHNGDLFLDDSNSMTTFVLKLPLIT
jgi:C4-dicarboxylate-specific signal transduction histidine kinase